MTYADPASDQRPLYPVRLWMEYPERLSRLTTFFRIVLAIPILFLLYFLQTNIVVASWMAILVRGYMPRWLVDFQVGYNRFLSRSAAYFLLLTDQYPKFDGDWLVQYWADYPPRLSRWKLVIWKFITLVPHIIALIGLWIAVLVVTIIGWFAVLFSGSYPRGLHSFVVGVMRWTARATAYFESLTDEFPPFTLEHEAAPGQQERAFAIVGAVVTALLVAGAVGIGVAVYRISNETETVRVSYEDALSGTLSPGDAFLDLDFVAFGLTGGVDDVDASTYGGLIEAGEGKRLVEFTVVYQNVRDDEDQRFGDHDIARSTLRLETEDDGVVTPVLLTEDGLVAPQNVERVRAVELHALFVIDDDDRVLELRGYTGQNNRHVAWQFE